MPTEGQAKALKLRRLQDTPRFLEDAAFALAVLVRYSELAEDDRAFAEQQFDANPDLMSDEPIRRGRRLDLEAEYQGRRQDNPEEKPPLIVKVSIAGSGYNGWKTQVDGAGKVLNWDRADDAEDKEEAVHHSRDKGKGPEMMFAGPGASDTKNASYFGGASDSGSNSIAELVEQVPVLVAEAIDAGMGTDQYGSVVILIRAHSRGAVAAPQVAAQLKAAYPDAQVELTQVDPVPGPDHKGDDVEFDIGGGDGFDGLDESTLVYSVASGYSVGFTPQKVHGAKRLIVSRQDHSVGLQNGFVYGGELYKGSSLNSLAEGVYVDMNENGKNTVELTRVADIDDAKARIQTAFDKSSAWTGDSDRMDIIGEIVAEVLEKYLEQV